MRVIIAAGGTAGHINPGLAIAEKIKLTKSAHIAHGNVCRVFFMPQEP